MTEARGEMAAPVRVEWVPAFPGQRPPFEPGNQFCVVRHGAYSPRHIDPVAAEIMAVLLEDDDLAYLAKPRWRLALLALCRAEAQVQLLDRYLASAAEAAANGVGDLKAEDVRAAYLLLHRAEGRASSQRRHLGLDPLSAARLGKDRASEALDTARLMARLERQEQARADAEGGDDGE